MYFFFFSSRRRHTRFSRDWSSDVCSSDLPFPAHQDPLLTGFQGKWETRRLGTSSSIHRGYGVGSEFVDRRREACCSRRQEERSRRQNVATAADAPEQSHLKAGEPEEIGRA